VVGDTYKSNPWGAATSPAVLLTGLAGVGKSECLHALKDSETEKIIKEFQITLRRDPKKSIDFVKSMNRSTNLQILNTVRNFCSQNKL
jgi:hypothetical protein